MPTLENESVCSKALTDEWYNRLRKEVDYQCTFCDAVHGDIKSSEQTIKNAYAITAKSLRGVHDIGEIAKRWFGMYIFASEVLAHGRILQESHQICGVDLTLLERYQTESLNRFKLHCPEFAEACADTRRAS